MPRSPDYPVPALEKGLDIMEALAAAAVPLSLAELASSLQRSSSELFRMLNCLERRGYLMREGSSGKYALSLKLFALAHSHSFTDQLLRSARRPMQAFTEKFRESCHLSVLERGQLLVIAQQQSPSPVRISIEVGGTFAAAGTASGRLLLAHLPPDELQAALEGARTARHSPSARSLRARLARIRATGVSFADSETIDGVRDLAVLVGRPDQGVAGALAVSRLVRRHERDNDELLLDGMRSAAAEITATLGLK